MSTTGLVVELIIVGTEALIWIWLLVCLLFGVGWVAVVWPVVANARVAWGVFLLFLAYTAGVIVDELCDAATSRLQRRLWRAEHGREGEPIWRMAASVESASGGARGALAYRRGRIRILRSSLFNVPLMTGLGAAVILKYPGVVPGHPPNVATLVVISGGLITLAVFYTYCRVCRHYAWWVEATHKALGIDDGPASPQAPSN